MKLILSGLFFSLILINHHDLMADDFPIKAHILHFDDVQKDFQDLYFKDKEKIKPGSSIFTIIEKYFMSNDLGERWAVLTIQNTSAGKRLLKNVNLVATYADGSQSIAQNIDETLDGNEILTKAVFFGIHKFPILTIELR